MKVKYVDVEATQNATTNILKSMNKNDLKNSLNMLVDHAKLCIKEIILNKVNEICRNIEFLCLF